MSIRDHSAPSVLVTGGAGYIGSALAGRLLLSGWRVTVVDRLDFGGESLLGFWGHPGFRFVAADLVDPSAVRAEGTGLAIGREAPQRFDAVVHLAAIVGFKACDAAGRACTWASNVDMTKRLFAAAEQSGISRFVFSSTYSNYGVAVDDRPVDENAVLVPQSLYAESKIAAEQWLQQAAATASCAPVLFRFATLFGVSPRTRFDLIINQFVLEAIIKRELVIYDREFTRSFVHVQDACLAIETALTVPKEAVHGEIYNVGAESGNLRKGELVDRIQAHVPETSVRHVVQHVRGDMRDICVSFAKIRTCLGFVPEWSIDAGIVQVRDAIQLGVITNPTGERYQNALKTVH